MVIIILGSKSDLQWGQQIADNLKNLSVKYTLRIASAHKTPENLLNLILTYNKIQEPIVYICVAGRSNALGGFVDANTHSPVINCPPPSEKYAGLDIFSSLRMPTGVSCMTVLEPEQAAVATAKIIGNSDELIRKSVSAYQKKIKDKVIDADQKIRKEQMRE